MKIALDAIGGDFGAGPLVEGAVQACRELGCEVTLVGPEKQIHQELKRCGIPPGKSPQILPAEDLNRRDTGPLNT